MVMIPDWQSVDCEFKYSTGFLKFFEEKAKKPSLISLILNTKSEKYEWQHYLWKHLAWGSRMYLIELSNPFLYSKSAKMNTDDTWVCKDKPEYCDKDDPIRLIFFCSVIPCSSRGKKVKIIDCYYNIDKSKSI